MENKWKEMEAVIMQGFLATNIAHIKWTWVPHITRRTLLNYKEDQTMSTVKAP